MGTNYYVISKNVNSKSKDLYKTYEELYNTDKLNNILKEVLMKEFKPSLDYINKDKELKYKSEIFEDELEEQISTFVSHIKYELLDVFNIEENKKVHIGKSSLGWLFSFQEQNTYIDNVHLEWHNYNQVKSWLEDYVNNKKQFIIINEYGNQVSTEELFDLIDTKQNDKRNLENPDNFVYNRNVDGYRFSSGDFS